jgi:hypothetical protein
MREITNLGLAGRSSRRWYQLQLGLDFGANRGDAVCEELVELGGGIGQVGHLHEEQD